VQEQTGQGGVQTGGLGRVAEVVVVAQVTEIYGEGVECGVRGGEERYGVLSESGAGAGAATNDDAEPLQQDGTTGSGAEVTAQHRHTHAGRMGVARCIPDIS
jgi:hypothetical protein